MWIWINIKLDSIKLGNSPGSGRALISSDPFGDFPFELMSLESINQSIVIYKALQGAFQVTLENALDWMQYTNG